MVYHIEGEGNHTSLIVAIGNNIGQDLSAILPLPLTEDSQWVAGPSYDGIFSAYGTVVTKDGQTFVLVGGVTGTSNPPTGLIRKFACPTLDTCSWSKSLLSLNVNRLDPMVFMAPTWLYDRIKCEN